MASRKRNDFLDIEESDAEQSDHGYDSEAAEESKTRASKRRKILDDNSDDDNRYSDLERGDDNDDDDDDDDHADAQEAGGVEISTREGLEKGNALSPSSTSSSAKQKREKTIRPILKPPKKDKSGVVYFSSLPPHLKPSVLKSLLIQRGFDNIGRVFLTPAVPSTSGNSKRSNRRKTYTDGWVEFKSKKTAKICAETLNANIVGGRKGGYFHDDVWNMKYLRGFKWADLMEQVQRERSEREAIRRIEENRARKEAKVFLSGVEKGKVMEGIRKKREEKKRQAMNTSDGDHAGLDDLQIRRVFRQNEVKQKRDDEDLDSIGDDARRVLGKIF